VKLLNPVMKNMQVDSLSGIFQTKTSCEVEQCRIYKCILFHFSSYVQHTPYTVRYDTTCPPQQQQFCPVHVCENPWRICLGSPV